MAPASYVALFAMLCGAAHGANVEDARARLKMAMQIAREHNDRLLVAKVEKAAREMPAKGEVDEARLREVESAVGIDPGGWSMAGQPLFHPTAAMLESASKGRDELAAAMLTNDPSKVRIATAKMIKILGDQAGVPDGRRPGEKTSPHPLGEADTAKLFVAAIRNEGSKVKQIAQGKPLPDQMLRLYAGILEGVCDIRPVIEKHAPEALADIDKLAAGCAKILLNRQQTSGLFPFPDLRGKNIRFGDMLTKAAKSGNLQVRDGWIITADRDGGTQFDTGVCGSALLAAAKTFHREDYKAAGLKAADWALKQDCVPNFNYNAFSVSLLARAFKTSNNVHYLEGALQKFRVGVAPGQAPNGRWIDSHNARTVYHVIILRALGDLAIVAPLDQRPEMDAIAKPALKALLDEFDAMGITVEALPELRTFGVLYPEDTKLKTAIEAMASARVAKCTDGTRVKLNVSPRELAGVAGVWPQSGSR